MWAVFLHAVIPPAFISAPKDTAVIEHDPVTFKCQVKPPWAEVTWFVGEEPVHVTDQRFLLMSEGDGTRILEIKDTSQSMAGLVTVRADQAQAQAQLTVEGRLAYSREYVSFVMALQKGAYKL